MISHVSADSDQLPAWLTSPGSWSWPENRTSLTLLPVICENAIASPAMTSPIAGRSTTSFRRDTTR